MILKLNRLSHIGRYSWVHFSKTFHSSQVLNGTHDYKVIDFSIPLSKYQNIVENQSTLTELRKLTGAVIRPKCNNDMEVLEDKGHLLIIGNSRQVRKASELLETVTNESELAEKSKHVQNNERERKLIWHGYKRNYKGQYPPEKPRKKCIRCGGKMVSGNPCPLCQLTLDSNYDIHYTDVEILNQFICPFTWKILQPSITGVCKMQQNKLEAAIREAKLHGYISFTLPVYSKEQKTFTPAGMPTDRLIKWKVH